MRSVLARRVILLVILVVPVLISIDAIAERFKFKAPPHFHTGVAPENRIGELGKYYEEFTAQRDYMQKTYPEEYRRIEALQRADREFETLKGQIDRERNATRREALMKRAEEISQNRHEILVGRFVEEVRKSGVEAVRASDGEWTITPRGVRPEQVGGTGVESAVREPAPGEPGHVGEAPTVATARPRAQLSDNALAAQRAVMDAFNAKLDAIPDLPPQVRTDAVRRLGRVIGSYVRERAREGKGDIVADDAFVQSLLKYVNDNVTTKEDVAAVVSFVDSILRGKPDAGEMHRTGMYFKNGRKEVVAGAARLTSMKSRLEGVKPPLTQEQISARLGEYVFAGEQFRAAVESDPELFNAWVTGTLSKKHKAWDDIIKKRSEAGLCEILKGCAGHLQLNCKAA